LYLHGMGASKRDFLAAAAEEPLRDYTLVAFDFPGCGETPYPTDRVLRVDDLVEITDQVNASLCQSSPVLIGHSMGGLVGLLYSAKHGARLKGFVDIEGNLSPQDCFLTRPIARLSFADFLATRHLDEVKQQFATAPHQGTRLWAQELGRQGSSRAFYDYAVSMVDRSDNEDLLAMFEGLPIPKLFVYGSANNHLSHLSRLKLSDASVIEAPYSGHWPHIDNPAYFYEALSRFLGAVAQ
jgi:pimeloyl-ACP methyl ester carboxylesterase